MDFEDKNDLPEGSGQETTITLDGSMGVGDTVYLTIFVKDQKNPVEGMRKETYLIPQALLDMKTLEKFFRLHFILGYQLLPKTVVEGSHE